MKGWAHNLDAGERVQYYAQDGQLMYEYDYPRDKSAAFDLLAHVLTTKQNIPREDVNELAALLQDWMRR